MQGMLKYSDSHPSFAGVTSDVGKVRETMDGLSHPALLLVDGVSSIGALDFQFDKWKVDVAVTGSQKALSLPTGLTLVAISEKVGDISIDCLASTHSSFSSKSSDRELYLTLNHSCDCRRASSVCVNA